MSKCERNDCACWVCANCGRCSHGCRCAEEAMKYLLLLAVALCGCAAPSIQTDSPEVVRTATVHGDCKTERDYFSVRIFCEESYLDMMSDGTVRWRPPSSSSDGNSGSIDTTKIQAEGRGRKP